MKLIIAGGRKFSDYGLVQKALSNTNEYITEIISGRCSDEQGVLTFTTTDDIKVYGADGLGERWANDNNIPVVPFPAQWTKYGNSAGPIRNEEMAEYADVLVIFWDGKSKGSASMISKMKALGKPLYIVKT